MFIKKKWSAIEVRGYVMHCFGSTFNSPALQGGDYQKDIILL